MDKDIQLTEQALNQDAAEIKQTALEVGRQTKRTIVSDARDIKEDIEEAYQDVHNRL